MSVILSARGLSKQFGSTRALRGVDIDLHDGKVMALMGANGAGKSTLVKILCGVQAADSGTIRLGDRSIVLHSPRQARAHGIIAVHQSIADVGVPTLSVADNLLLDRYCAGDGSLFVGGRAGRMAARDIAAAIGLDVLLDRPLADLSIADRQLVAIARAVAHRPKVLIFDEPTASLSAPESERLFRVIDRLRDAGVAILYISHKIGDLQRIADRAVVMRDGQIAGSFARPIDFHAAIRDMIGREITRQASAGLAYYGRPLLEVERARLAEWSAPFDLVVRAGEVIAVTGPVGAGKTTLAGALFGLWPLAAGNLRLDGAAWAPKSAEEAIRHGVFMAGEDRWRTSFFPKTVPFADISGTISFPFLPRWSRHGVLPAGLEERTAERLIREFGIKARGPGDPLTALSGGNQQKVVLARWHAEPALLLLLDEPFQGVDIGARNDIIRAIRAHSAERATIVFVNDLEEAFEVGDRVLVLVDHTIVGDAGAELHDAVGLLGSADSAAVMPPSLSSRAGESRRGGTSVGKS